MDKRQANPIGAAIDVGSNSIHLLVARLSRPAATARRRLTVLNDSSQLLGLGDVVDEQGDIPPGSLAEILDALAELLALAHTLEAGEATLIGTEPLRRASNAAHVAAQVERVTGLRLHTVSVRIEAELTFMGVTGGWPPAAPLITVDIGGGSTEIGIHVPGAPFTVVALPVGSARLTNAIVKHDPPTTAELALLHQAALEVTQDMPAWRPAGTRRPRAVFVGGTATNLARLGRLTSEGLAEDRRTLARLTSAEVTGHFGVRPRRAQQLAAGAAIVEVLLDHFGLKEALVSEASLREGAIIAAARFGDAWPERLAEVFAPANQPLPGPASVSH